MTEENGGLTMPEYSISQLGAFEKCALQYKFAIHAVRTDLKSESALLSQHMIVAVEISPLSL
jgi:hypothetical protein